MKFCVNKVGDDPDRFEELLRDMPVGEILESVKFVLDGFEILSHAGSDIGHARVIVQVRVRVIVFSGDVLVAVMLRVKMMVSVVVGVAQCVWIQLNATDGDARGVDRNKKIRCLIVHDQNIFGA